MLEVIAISLLVWCVMLAVLAVRLDKVRSMYEIQAEESRMDAHYWARRWDSTYDLFMRTHRDLLLEREIPEDKIVIKTPTKPYGIKSVVFNGKEYSTELAKRVVFEAVPDNLPSLTIDYISDLKDRLEERKVYLPLDRA